MNAFSIIVVILFALLFIQIKPWNQKEYYCPDSSVLLQTVSNNICIPGYEALEKPSK